MSAPRRVLFISHELECGGAELSLLELMAALDRDRYTPILATSGHGALHAAASALDIPVFTVPMRANGRLRKLRRVWTAGRTLAAIARREHVDILHANTIIAGWAGRSAARRSGCPLVWHVRDIGYPALARRACSRATRIVANSEATGAALQLPASARPRLRVVYNGIAPEFFATERPRTDQERIELRRSLLDQAGISLPTPDESTPGREHPWLGMLGRLDPWKGHATAIRSLAAADIPCHLFVVGGALFGTVDRTAELLALAEAEGVRDRVTFVGSVPPDRVIAWLTAFDVLLQPSETPEPFGRSVAEALAVGTPVIGSDAGGIPEIVTDGVHGRLAPPGNVWAWARAIREVLARSDRGRAFGEAGRSMAARRFGRDHHAAGIAAVYDELLVR